MMDQSSVPKVKLNSKLKSFDTLNEHFKKRNLRNYSGKQ